MAEQKRTCGQCELYLNKKEKCPHQEKTAFSEGCEIFVYTNPEVRIDALQAENERLKKTLEEASSDFYYIHRHSEDAHTDSYNFMNKVNETLKEPKRR